MAASGAEGTIENSSGSCSGRSKLFYDLNNHHSLKGLIAYHYSRRTDIDVKSANKLVLDAGSEEVIDPNAIAFFLSQSEFACESNCLESAQTIQWISFSSQDIRNSVAAIDLQRGKTADHMAHLRKCLSVLDLHLKLKTYLVGEQVTLADVCVMVDLLPAFRSPSIMNPSAKADLPHVTRWFNTIINQRLVKETIETYGFDSTAASKLPNPSKKARSKTQDTNESSKRTEKQVLRILCVHGYRQTGKSFREKLGAFRKLLGKRTELVFITAPHIVPSLGEGDDIVSKRTPFCQKIRFNFVSPFRIKLVGGLAGKTTFSMLTRTLSAIRVLRRVFELLRRPSKLRVLFMAFSVSLR